MRQVAVVVAALLAGCNFQYETTGASSEVEGALLAYTDQYAAVLGVDVRGEIVTNLAAGQEAGNPAGFYSRGVVYYYRPVVKDMVTLVDGVCPAAPRCELASGVAAHEVCHAVSDWHDTKHWCCMKGLGVRPTYDAPVKVNGQFPVCDGR